MGAPGRPTQTLSSSTGRRMLRPIPCKATPPTTTQEALARAGLGGLPGGVWVRELSLTFPVASVTVAVRTVGFVAKIGLTYIRMLFV
jgi:hypothetical protein